MGPAPHPAFCACCTPRTAPAPVAVSNRPGLQAISWRSGRYATVRQAMIEAMATGVPRGDGLRGDADDQWPLQVRNALAALTTRDDADYAILAIDMFAAVADVLGFYSERYANEMFLRTARERDSLLRLVRLIGYRLAPGQAATAALAFTLDAGAAAKIRAGLKVMSVPGQDEVAQVYETVGAIAADARLNALPLWGAPGALAPFAVGRTRFPIVQRPERVLQGDTLALVGNDELQLVTVRGVASEADGEWLTLAAAVTVSGATKGFRLKRSLRFFGHDVPGSHGFYDANPAVAPAKRWKTLTAGVDYPLALGAGAGPFALDGRFDDLKPGTLLLIDRGPGVGRYVFARISSVASNAAALGPLAATVTWVGLQQVNVLGGDGLAVVGGMPAIADRRQARIFELVRPQVVTRGYVYPEGLSGGSAVVRGDDLDDFGLLVKKQRIVVSDGVVQHAAVIGSVVPMPAGADGVAQVMIGFSPAIGLAMARPVMNANVAPASHGETQPEEPLGHGDAGAVFQAFALRRGPLTRLPGATGIAPVAELAVRVNGELWSEAASLFGHGPGDRVYAVRDDDAGVTHVQFGDGRTGARLPSGASNVVARYRTGAGLPGRMRGGQLTTLLERPVGVRAVTNALPSDGGIDAETLVTARTAAPATVRTFGRAIALMDFEDVARQTGIAFAARATWAFVGLEQAIQLTVAGAGGQRLSAEAMALLHGAMGSARDPNHLLLLGNLWRVPVVVSARVMRDAAYEADAVGEAVLAAVTDFFAFEVQPMGRALHLSQLVAAMQAVRGVVAVDVDRFHIKGFGGWTAAQLARRGATAAAVQAHVRLFDARPRPGAGMLDPLVQAGLALDPETRVLPAEQAYVAVPATDVVLSVVDAL